MYGQAVKVRGRQPQQRGLLRAHSQQCRRLSPTSCRRRSAQEAAREGAHRDLAEERHCIAGGRGDALRGSLVGGEQLAPGAVSRDIGRGLLAEGGGWVVSLWAQLWMFLGPGRLQLSLLEDEFCFTKLRHNTGATERCELLR